MEQHGLKRRAAAEREQPGERVYCWEHKIQYYETDQMQIAHHSNYIRWFEEARTSALEEAGFGYAEMEAAGIISPVLTVSAEYVQMSRFPETLLVETRVRSYNGIRLCIHYEVRERQSGELRCVGESSHCFLRAADHRPVSLKHFSSEIHRRLCAMK